MLELDIATLSLLAGTVIPLLVGLVVKLNTSSRVKAILNLVLSITAGGVSFLVANSGKARWQELVLAMIEAYIASGVSYQNLWKPTGAAKVVQSVGSPAPERSDKFNILPELEPSAADEEPDDELCGSPYMGKKCVLPKGHPKTQKHLRR